MPVQSIKNWSYRTALSRQLAHNRKSRSRFAGTNPARSVLMLFNGTRPEDVEFFRKKHGALEKEGIKPKMLAFVSSKVDVHDFGMALYNETRIKWNLLPRPKLVELVQSREFDLLFNLNPEQLPHLHFLAVAANARFKLSTFSDFPHDFDLTVKTKAGTGLQELYMQMTNCLDEFSV